MLQLLAPASSTDAVMAAVQSGADIVYMGEGLTAPGKGEREFGQDALAQSIQYCRVRGCRAVVSMAELFTDDELPLALDRAVFAAGQGAYALIVRDVGLITALRRTLPDMPLWGDVRLGIDNADAAAAAAALGLQRIILAPELSADQVETIAASAPIDVMVCVHGPMCVAHSGQCYIGAMSLDHLSDSRMRCAELCREKFSLGGRMDERPTALADVCLIDHLGMLEAVGVKGAVIDGRSRKAEYVAYVTRLYSRAIREKVMPSQEEMDTLREDFSSGGLTDGYFTGERGKSMFAAPTEPSRGANRLYGDIRKSYRTGELRRVPVTFYVVMKADQPALFAAEDGEGHRAVHQGFEPVETGLPGVSDDRVREILYRTSGTPYICQAVNCAIDPNLDYPDMAVEEARKSLLNQLADKSRELPEINEGERPEMPEPMEKSGPPKLIIQVTHAEQLTAELAATGPDLLYVPAELLAGDAPGLEHFLIRDTQVVAVLPRVAAETDSPVLQELLAVLRAKGIRQVLLGNLGMGQAARQAGMSLRGDFGLNIANSWALNRLGQAGFLSLTASFELTAKQIAALSKSVPTEMIVYGRVPVMVTDHCLIRNSAGRCSCATPTSMNDSFGVVYPVEKEFGCRNTVYDGRKIFLADRPELYTGTDLWGLRLWFTQESPKECVTITERYKARNTYMPINVGRGAYVKGAL